MTRAAIRIGGAEDFAAAFAVSRETVDRLGLYSDLLHAWQARHNLVADDTLGALWSRHFADSAQLVALAPEARIWADMGSGAGFPGLVVALMLAERPGARVHLIESNAKKCAFLNTVRRETGAPATVHKGRAEEVLPELANHLDAVCARAVAPLERLLRLSAGVINRGATGLFLKGQDVDAELTQASRYWNITARTEQSLINAGGRILIVTACQLRGNH